MRPVRWCLLLAALVPASLPATGPGEQDAEDSTAMAPEEVVVVATRLPRPLASTAARVERVDAAEISRSMSENIDAVLALTPGADVQSDGTRFGAASINIRGIGDNRVGIFIDGVPQPDGFAVGAYSNSGRGLVETDRIKRMEVLYGPSSILYGSNAMGGVLAITTWDPDDLLAGGAGNTAARFRAAYRGANSSLAGSAIAAGSSGAHGLLAAGTWREGHELENQAPADVPVDPQDWTSQDYLVRYTWEANSGNRLSVSASLNEHEAMTDIRSQLGYGQRFRWTTSLIGDDRELDRRIVLDYRFSAAGWEAATFRLYGMRSKTDQSTTEHRDLAPRPVRIERRFLYEQNHRGAELFAFRNFMLGSTRHRLGVGASWSSGEIEELRDGLQTDKNTGQTTPFILGERMPVRDFPITRVNDYALWLQDEIELGDDRWSLIPGLRWDRYTLDPRPDDIWREDNPNTGVVSIDDDRVTPRVGLVFRPTGRWSLYAQYAEGFRAPPFSDANIGFEIPLFGFRAIPNPDLESETSRSLETGLRYFGTTTRWHLSAFHSKNENFIESRALVGIDPATGDLIFQSRNIDEATIRGVDLGFRQDLSAWSPRLERWTLGLNAWWTEGDNDANGEALNSIAPPQATVELGWESASGTWDGLLTGTLTAAKHPEDIDQTIERRFATPSWATVDVSLGWRPLERLELRAGVFNLFDETYWRWLDVSRLQADNPMIPVLSRPGRNYSLSLQARF